MSIQRAAPLNLGANKTVKISIAITMNNIGLLYSLYFSYGMIAKIIPAPKAVIIFPMCDLNKK